MKEIEPTFETNDNVDDLVSFWATEMLTLRVKNGYMTRKEMDENLKKLDGSFFERP